MDSCFVQSVHRIVDVPIRCIQTKKKEKKAKFVIWKGSWREQASTDEITSQTTYRFFMAFIEDDACLYAYTIELTFKFPAS